MSNLERTVKIWVDTLNNIFDIVFQSCNEWNPDVWAMIKNINAGLTIVASSLIVLFFFIGMLKSGMTVQDFKRPETAFKPLLRLAVANAFTNASMSIMILVFQVIQGLMSTVASYGSASFVLRVPSEVKEAIDDTSMFSWDGIRVGLVGLLLMLGIYVMAIIITVVVWGRFIKLYIFCGVSPLFIAGSAGEPTQGMAVNFIKGYANAVFQGVVVVLALLIYSALMSSDSSAAVAAVQAGDPFGGILLYAKDFFIAGCVILGICKGADQLVSKMGL